MSLRLKFRHMRRALKRPFAISRGVRTHADTLVVTLVDAAGRCGRGEAVPYARLGESMDDALSALAALAETLPDDLDFADIAALSRLKSVRTALDCALHDLRARQEGRAVWQRLSLPRPKATMTASTISLNTPEAMAAQAAEQAGQPLLKIKLGGPDGAEGDLARLAAVRRAAPRARLIVDANEGWAARDLKPLLEACADHGGEMVGQPLPAGEDSALAEMKRPVPVIADESVHDVHDLPRIAGRYDGVNVKLDKAGGLTPALALARAARDEGLSVMIGCMLASSLAMAPAFLLAPFAQWVDLDGPLWIAEDEEPRMRIESGIISPPSATLWGGADAPDAAATGQAEEP